MNKDLADFAARLRERILSAGNGTRSDADGENPAFADHSFDDFNALALDLFRLQFASNAAYQRLCAARGATPLAVRHWTQIPAAPTTAFKELELTSIAIEDRQAVFHSSGTTEQKPSRHFHHEESLAVYEASLWTWFARHFELGGDWMFLTPPPTEAPHSSLIHMFDTIRGKLALPPDTFAGHLAADASWVLDFSTVLGRLQAAVESGRPMALLGTAFSFVHLLDHLVEKKVRFRLPAGSRVMETGGYKNRSRTMPKAQLHELISERLGVGPEKIICEYGMSELSSQGYAAAEISALGAAANRFRLPPWARAQIISPETGREAEPGAAGIIRIFDLANVYSVAAVQSEDLGIRRGDGFELIGRAENSEPRGCSLMTIAP